MLFRRDNKHLKSQNVQIKTRQDRAVRQLRELQDQNTQHGLLQEKMRERLRQLDAHAYKSGQQVTLNIIAAESSKNTVHFFFMFLDCEIGHDTFFFFSLPHSLLPSLPPSLPKPSLPPTFPPSLATFVGPHQLNLYKRAVPPTVDCGAANRKFRV